MSCAEILSANPKDVIHKIETGLENALRDIFLTMFNAGVTVVPHEEILDAPRISTVVGFTGRLCGMLCLHFSSDMACRVASGLLGMPCDTLDENVRDAIGETSNMVAGGLKKEISSTDDMFKISIPTVISGVEYSMHAPANAHQVWMGIEAGGCRFKIQLVLEQR
jgi:CheY-specific phosphatase CheX